MKYLYCYGKNILELFHDNYDDFDKLTQEEKDCINSITDYELINYTVIDNESVIISDSLNGDVLAMDNIVDFMQKTINYIKEVTK